MKAKLLLVLPVLLAGCETPLVEEAKQAAVEEPIPAGCSVRMAERWSVAVPGMDSAVVNFLGQNHETKNVPIIVEVATPTRVTFSYVLDPIAGPDRAYFDVSANPLKTGVCALTGSLRMAPTPMPRSVTMVPLTAAKYSQ